MELKKLERLYQIFERHPKVITDSRKIEKGCLFFALKGERFNGNEFAEEAIHQGAAFAIIDEGAYQRGEQYILVEDVLVALQKLANFHRRQMIIPVIGITGSNGKTTTKELLAEVLSKGYHCHYTKGNFNNHIGVPLTLLELTKEHEVAIIEMGANHVGEIAFLSNIAEPTHGIITNIGKAHLEGFGGIEGVKKGKSELYKFIKKHNNVAFVNMDEPYLTELSEGVSKRVFYKKSEIPDPDEPIFETILYQTHPFVKVGYIDEQQNERIIQSQLIGKYNFSNIMTALTVGRYFRVPHDKIKEAIENYIPTNNRSQIVQKNNNTFILDAYNANPTSMKNAIENLKNQTAKHKIAILGDMLELGEYSELEHQKIFDLAKTLDLDHIILVGIEFSKIGVDQTNHFENVDDLKEWFTKKDFQNTLFLIKGSRAIRLEQLIA